VLLGQLAASLFREMRHVLSSYQLEMIGMQVDTLQLLHSDPDTYAALEQSPSEMSKAASYICSSLRNQGPTSTGHQALHVYIRPLHALQGCCTTAEEFQNALNLSSESMPTTMALHGKVVKISNSQVAVHAILHQCSACQ
jgi:DNA replicative helicase MCM subunit Mcm2 (Cdc46/Mcm family)